MTSAALPGGQAPSTRRSVTLEVRQGVSSLRQALAIAGGLGVGLGISVAILVSAGVDLPGLWQEFVVYTLFRPRGLASTLVEATPLVLVGLSAAIAFRVRFWNIGIEGQFLFGAMGAALIALYDVGPEATRLPLMLLAALAGGALWTVLPLVLKLRLSVNEIISTLLLNYVAGLFLLDLLYGAWQDPVNRFPHTPQFGAAERLPPIGFETVSAGLVVALVAAALVAFLALRSRIGLYMTVTGSNPEMARAVGIPVVAVTAVAVFLAGALSGLAGFVVAAGTEYRLTTSIAGGYLFSGIVVAFLARNNPVAAIVVAFLLGALYVGGQSLQVFYNLSAGVIELLQAIVVLSVAGSEFFVRYRIVRHGGAAPGAGRAPA